MHILGVAAKACSIPFQFSIEIILFFNQNVMEEIKFRGMSKMLDHNKMIFGYGCYTDESLRKFILVDDEFGKMRPIQVEEIGLHTGLKDKNVYEFDIIGEPRVGKEHESIGIVEFDNDLNAFVIKKFNGGWEYLSKHLLNNLLHEVIGNKFENPEILN